jgi:hypothetical protein
MVAGHYIDRDRCLAAAWDVIPYVVAEFEGRSRLL